MRVSVRSGFTAALGVVALSGVAHAAAAPSPTRYRAEMNAMCRRTTVKLHTIEAELRTARNAGDARAYALGLGEYLGLGLREDETIETAPMPASLRPVMAPVMSVLKRIDGHVRAMLTGIATGNGKALQADVSQLAALSGPANRDMDAAGLRDCGSNQT